MISPDVAARDFRGIRAELNLPEAFPAEVEAEAAAAGRPVAPPVDREDATDLPLVTIDPPGSRDLDQALYVERVGDGFRVHYAIADLGSVIAAGGALDAEARRRGQTLYLPDGNVPLHPTVLSEGASSLLPNQVRPAALWTIDCGADGEPTGARVRRALVRSTAQFDYAGVQSTMDAGNPHPSIAELPALGRLRRELAVARGAVELKLPEQEIARDDTDGGSGWRLVLRRRTDVDDWNAEISLLTGMAAAAMMLDAKVGILRTLPEPDDGAVAWLRRSAASLGIDWPTDMGPGRLLAGLDPGRPAALALLMDATRLLRGAGYTAFDGELPELRTHAGIAAAYTHVTAPLRRLVDRFGTEVCLAVSAGTEVPDWVRAALPQLPDLMQGSDALANKVDRACLDQVEAWTLAERLGDEFDAVVLRAEEDGGEVFVAEPPVIARCAGGGLSEGGTVRARVVTADTASRTVGFELVRGERS